jgi:hypothetical protein
MLQAEVWIGHMHVAAAELLAAKHDENLFGCFSAHL